MLRHPVGSAAFRVACGTTELHRTLTNRFSEPKKNPGFEAGGVRAFRFRFSA
jgi:hypothetical protein